MWRRRQCSSCKAVFTTIEGVDATQALRVSSNKRYEPFSRDKLLLSIYDSLRHRKTATEDATAITATILSHLYPFITDTVLVRDDIAKTTALVLGRFDKAAATSYRAFHPLSERSEAT
ncbi:MAG TPA: hypothetical protein VK674_06860 [Candidatus Limnocylindria bacterium]|nr:hypothetical protein [Candidatus Limnocylindria bacterium]